MAIDLITKYAPTMLKGFERDSYTLNKAAKGYEITGAKTIKYKSYKMDDSDESWPSIATRTQVGGGNRFGTPTDVEDVTQEMTLRYHTRWTKSMDKSDKMQGSLHEAAAYMRQHNNEVDMPKRDKRNLREWAFHAGKTMVATAALGSATGDSAVSIIDVLLDLEAELDEKNVPQENRWCYCPIKYRKFIRTSGYWEGADNLTRDMIVKGYQGNIGTLKMCFVPSTYLPPNVEMLVTYEGSVIAPLIMVTARILEVVQGYDGPVLEYHDFYDAFVIGVKQDGVITLLKYGQSAQATVSLGNPATASSVTTVTVTATSGSTVYYTMDGTDPKWSNTAMTTTNSGTITITGFTGTIRAVARLETAGSEKYTSEEAKQAYTNGAKS